MAKPLDHFKPIRACLRFAPPAQWNEVVVNIP